MPMHHYLQRKVPSTCSHNFSDDARHLWCPLAFIVNAAMLIVNETSLLALLLQALNETSREDAEWILWMDLDTVAVESNIAFPLADYEGKDLVLWIQPDLVLEGDAFREAALPCLV